MKSSEIKIFGCILVVALVLVALSLAPVLLQQQRKPGPRPEPKLTRAMLVKPNDHIKGDPNAPTTIVVYSDFQCPSCRDGVTAVNEILEKQAGKVNEVFRHFQVKPDHQYSRMLSRAAEAAGKQGKFWEMHALLFDNQKEIIEQKSEKGFVKAVRKTAQTAGVDMMQFDADMAKNDDSQFQEDQALGDKIRLTGTPTYFVIGPDGKVSRYSSTAELKEWARKQQPGTGTSQG